MAVWSACAWIRRPASSPSPISGVTEFEFRELRDGDIVAGFSLGDPQFTPLKTFLQKHAKTFAEHLLSRTYVSVQDGRVCAYISLACGELAADKIPMPADMEDVRFPHGYFPAVRITRLAVDRRFRDRKMGWQLVDFSIKRIRDIAHVVGCRFVVVDAKLPAVKFYERCGFRMIDTLANREKRAPVMFLDLRGIMGSPPP